MEMVIACRQRNATPWPFIKIDDFVSSLSVLKLLQMAMRTRTKNQSKNLAPLSHQNTKKSSTSPQLLQIYPSPEAIALIAAVVSSPTVYALSVLRHNPHKKSIGGCESNYASI